MLIIDGYNLLFAIARFGGRPVAKAIEEARARLLDQLIRYHRSTGEAITIVFDKRKHTGGARAQESLPGIRIVYSHPPRTADDEIRRLVEGSTAPRHIRIVTSDRELARACRERGASVVGARTFFTQLTSVVRRADADEDELRLKQNLPSADELAEWLEAFGEAGQSEEE